MQAPKTSPTPPTHRLRVLAVAGGTAAALLVASAPASAAEATAPATGTTTIKLSSAVKSAMKKGKITLSGIAPARRGATAVKLPLTSATIDAAAGSGTLNHSGSLRFKRGKRSVTLKTFRIALSPSAANASVGIGSSRVRSFEVDTSGVKITQARTKTTLANLKVTLTPIGASRLNRALGGTRFKSGATFGIASAAVATTPGAGTGTGPGAGTPAAGSTLKSGTSTLSLTPEAKAGIAAGGATLGTVAPATGSGTGPYAFPISSGSLDAARAFAGTASLGGSLTLTAQGNTITMADPIVDLGAAVITAVVNGTRVEAFSLDLSAVRNARYDGQLVLDGIIVKRAKSGPLADPQGAPSGVIGTLRIDAKTD